jgi:hypothetical protein
MAEKADLKSNLPKTYKKHASSPQMEDHGKLHFAKHDKLVGPDYLGDERHRCAGWHGFLLQRHPG